MVGSTDITLQAPAVEDSYDERDRWPLVYSALLVLGSSTLLWSMIVGSVRWLFG